MAAVAALPHRNLSNPMPNQKILNFLVLLLFWSFLYAYVVFPYQYGLSNGVSYALRFDILYLLESLTVVSAALAACGGRDSTEREI